MSALNVMLVCEGLDLAGGVERFVCALANHLAGQGMAVSVATVATPRAQVRYPLLPAVRVLHGDATALRVGGGPLRLWQLARKQWHLGRTLARLATQDRPDVLILNGVTTACPVLLLGRSLAPRSICCDHNHFDARSRPWRWLRQRLYARAAAVVSLTEADRGRFAAINPRTEVIANASLLHADEPALPAAPRVLAVGRHVAQKGFDLLLTAWAVVLKHVPEARLEIVGEGPLQPSLQAQASALGIAQSVTWTAPTPAVEAHYRAAAVFVLPSRYEGMPLALLEAQALGVPCVAFDCPTGPREVIGTDPETRTGVVVPVNDTDALAEALLTLLTQPDLRERMGRAAIERSRRLFSPTLHLQRWTELAQRVGAARA